MTMRSARCRQVAGGRGADRRRRVRRGVRAEVHRKPGMDEIVAAVSTAQTDYGPMTINMAGRRAGACSR